MISVKLFAGLLVLNESQSRLVEVAPVIKGECMDKLIIGILTGALIFGIWWHFNEVENAYNEGYLKGLEEQASKVDTVYKYVSEIDTIFVPRFSVKYDTLIKKDSIFITPDYIAEVDTTLEDSSLSLNVSYHSDIPLSVNSYFDINAEVKQREITRTILQEVPVYRPRKVGLIGGVETNYSDIYGFLGGKIYIWDTKHLNVSGRISMRKNLINGDWTNLTKIEAEVGF